MFESSTRIHPYLKEDVERAEALAGCQVLSAQIFSIPYIVYEVDCEIQQSRRMGLLEEFLLRAAVELKPPVSGDDLADMLRVDPRFVEQTYRDLVQLQALDASNGRLLRATPTGETFYRQDRLPQPPHVITRELVSALPFTMLALYHRESRTNKQLEDEAFPGFPYSSEMQRKLYPARHRNDINAKLLTQITAQAGQPLDRPEDGISFVRIVTWRVDRTMRYSHWAVLVVRDLLADRDEGVSIQLRSLDLPITGQKQVTGEIETALQGFIETVLREKILPLGDLMHIDQAEVDQLMEIQPPKMRFSEIESRAAAAEAVVRSRVSEIRSTPSTLAVKATGGTAELIRAGEIRARFLSTLKSARQRVLIVSPVLNEQMIDNELLEIFKALAAKRVITLLGWGIRRSQVEEEIPPTEGLIQKLAQTTTPEGLPAVVVLWLGNQHSKDVIIDYAIHLCGSQPWFSYRGGYLPRGESTYRITIPEPVKSAAGYLEQLFTGSAQAEYDTWLSHEAKTSDLARLISIWIGSGQFTEAYRHVLYAAHHARPEALSFLVPLCQAASEVFYGATPETRTELLQAIGEFGMDFAADHDHPVPNGESPILSVMSKADRKAFVKNLQNLMKRLAEQNPVKAQQIKETYLVFWNSLGITGGDS